MSCPELYSQVKSDNNFFLAGILGARSQFCKGLFSYFFIFVGKSRELSRTVFKSEIGQKQLFFGEDFLDFFIFVGKSLF